MLEIHFLELPCLKQDSFDLDCLLARVDCYAITLEFDFVKHPLVIVFKRSNKPRAEGGNFEDSFGPKVVSRRADEELIKKVTDVSQAELDSMKS